VSEINSLKQHYITRDFVVYAVLLASGEIKENNVAGEIEAKEGLNISDGQSSWKKGFGRDFEK